MSKEYHNIESNEITLKELILKFQRYFFSVVKNRNIILYFIVPFLLFFVYRALTTSPVFNAQLTFMVNEEGGGSAGVSALLGQFGLGASSSKANLDKILNLSKSRTVIEKVLFDEIVIEGKRDLIANHIIDLYDYHETWVDDTTGLKGFYFTSTDVNGFSRVENKVFKTLHSKIIGTKVVEPLLQTEYGESTGIMSLEFSSLNETLSIEFCRLLFSYLSDFYVKKTTEKQQQTFDVIKARLDKLEKERSLLEYNLANFKDSNRGLYTTKSKLKEVQLQRDVQIVNEAYAVTLKNFEIASFSLKNQIPFIQEIDTPIAPIKPVGESLVKGIILGVVLGGILGTFFIITREVYYDIMVENN